MTKNILEWLEASCQKHPSKIAVADETAEMTYEELVKDAKILGTKLATYIQPRQAVAMYMEKSNTTLAAMYGAVYAGGFYSLIDTRQPIGRIEKILEVLNPNVILSNERFYEEAREKLGSTANIVKVEDIIRDGIIDENMLAGIRKQAASTDPLYVNFTSGSTGVPKGVVVGHGSVIDFIPEFVKVSGICTDDRIANQAPFDFDVSVKDIYSSIYVGARVELIPREFFSNPTHLMDFLCDHQVTVLTWAVSAMCFVSIMNGFGYRNPETIRLVMFSGEVMPIKHLNIWMKNCPKAEFINLYGPTEITCNCTYYRLENREYNPDEIIPIGSAFDNEKVFLLSDENKLVDTPNESGEICVAGACLALGYYHDAEKTAAVFVQNPLNTVYYERMYRTGDLAKYNEQGELVYIGRKDFQIKHLGHRIELGEIESLVQGRSGVVRACAIYDHNKKRIYLFWLGERDQKELHNELKVVMPSYMVPNKLVHLDEMPMTKNGKIDRAVLKKMEGIE